MTQMVKNQPTMQETQVLSLCQKDPLVPLGALLLACSSPLLASLCAALLDLLTVLASLLRQGHLSICFGYCQAVALDRAGSLVGRQLMAWTVYHRVLVI